MKIKRTWLAAICAPAIVPLLYFAATVAFSGYLDTGEGHLLKFFQATIGAVLPISYLMSFVLGCPILWGLNKLQCMSMPSVLVVSGMVAFSLGGAWGLLARNPDGSPGLSMEQMLNIALISGAAGFAVSLIFCLIAGIAWRDISQN